VDLWVNAPRKRYGNGFDPGSSASSSLANRSSVAQTRQAAVTALAPTARAVAAQVAPTVQAAATQSIACVGTSIVQSPVQITGVTVAGQDTTVTLHNSSQAQMTLTNWTVLLGAAFYVGLTSVTVGAGQDMTLHFATGIDTPMDTYLGLGTSVVSVAFEPWDARCAGRTGQPDCEPLRHLVIRTRTWYVEPITWRRSTGIFAAWGRPRHESTNRSVSAECVFSTSPFTVRVCR
jgi:hypothetical protein